MAVVHGKALEVPGIEDAEVKLIWTPKWDPKVMASEDAKDQLGIFLRKNLIIALLNFGLSCITILDNKINQKRLT